MNYNSFAYLYQRRQCLPMMKTSDIVQRIKNSDFLVADDKGTHRLVGLKYDAATMHCPKITIICMRHQVAQAKLVAFSLGKKIYYNSDTSTRLFGYAVGDFIQEKDHTCCAKLYSRFLQISHTQKQEAKDYNRIRINAYGEIILLGKKLPSFFTVNDVRALLGKPDIARYADSYEREKEYIWNEWGMRICSYCNERRIVHSVEICLKKNKFKNLPECAREVEIDDTLLQYNNKTCSGWTNRKIMRTIWAVDKEDTVCKKMTDVSILHITYESYPYPLLAAIDEKEKFFALLSKKNSAACIEKRFRLSRETPLIFAAKYNRTDFIEPLLQNGANPNAQDIAGCTALFYTIVYHQNVAVARILLEYGADVNLPYKNDFTALKYAKIDRNEEMIQLLLEYGATEQEKSPVS